MRSRVLDAVPYCAKRKELDFNLQDFQSAEKKMVCLKELLHHVSAGSRVCISGGHYFIDPKDPYTPGSNPCKTFELAVSLASTCILNGNLAKLSLIMNDAKLHPDNSHAFWEYFVFPPAYMRLMVSGGLSLSDIVVTTNGKKNPWLDRVHSERALANRFSSKSKTRGFGNRYPAVAEKYVRQVGQDPDAAMGCFKGTVEFFEDLVDLGFDTLVAIFPTCSHTNIEYALAASKEAHPDVHMYGLFYTENCY